jgi:hypothetical protein
MGANAPGKSNDSLLIVECAPLLATEYAVYIAFAVARYGCITRLCRQAHHSADKKQPC